MPTITLAERIHANRDALQDLADAYTAHRIDNGFDNRPSWDNVTGGGGFDNRDGWDNV